MLELAKGNVAVVKGALLAGCRAYYGYPITPASEIAEAAALYFPQVGGVFLQAESEVAAINMVYGAASAGVRVMTASSGPGVSLMQEGISYLAGAELPCVIVDIVRGGPGLGNIAPEQSDIKLACRGLGHGNTHAIVLAPGTPQEMLDLAMEAFTLSFRYRIHVVILGEGYLGTELLHPHQPSGLYLTIDRWRSEADWQRFLANHGTAYRSLDARLAPLCAEDTEVGSFTVP